jgi:hypothetical protein
MIANEESIMNRLHRNRLLGVAGLLLALTIPASIVLLGSTEATTTAPAAPSSGKYLPRQPLDSSGFGFVVTFMPQWSPDDPLDRIAARWERVGHRLYEALENQSVAGMQGDVIRELLTKASMLNFEGEPERAYGVLADARQAAEADPVFARNALYTIIYYQGVTSLRRGETENCVMCRGESSCILPLSPAAIHTKPIGSRLAIVHFTEYLAEFPNDLEVKWLLNIAHMTLGEHPAGVDPRFLVSLDRYNSPEHGIGRFRDIGHIVGVNRLNQAGGAIMDDFDNDGRLDVVLTTFDPTTGMLFLRNAGNGTFEDRTAAAGVADQLGGLNCVQGDFDNDGLTDVFIPRGAWVRTPMRPTLLRNLGGGRFADATKEARLLAPMNSISAQWVDFDLDGRLDLFICGERQANRLYRNLGNGTFEDVAGPAGLALEGGGTWKGAAWADFDGDRYPDVYISNLRGQSRYFRNRGNGTFEERTAAMGIAGPSVGFSCWAFDYDNDGWPDIFATSYEHTVSSIVGGMLGKPNENEPGRLYRNLGGKGFQDVAKDVGLDLDFGTMGSNFADFDNDGFLDFYLGTGDPQLSMLIPNRMMRNLGGKRFADITGSSGTGHLQKGHGVAIGDWDRNGTADILIEMGGAVNGDRYHNVLFQNPGGHGNDWLNVKLAGKKSNRSAIGTRIKIVTAGDHPQTIHRWVTHGSSFGANPLEQLIGLGKAKSVARLEVYWPATDTTQVFLDVPANQAIEITEFDKEYRKRDYKPISLP